MKKEINPSTLLSIFTCNHLKFHKLLPPHAKAWGYMNLRLRIFVVEEGRQSSTIPPAECLPPAGGQCGQGETVRPALACLPASGCLLPSCKQHRQGKSARYLQDTNGDVALWEQPGWSRRIRQTRCCAPASIGGVLEQPSRLREAVATPPHIHGHQGSFSVAVQIQTHPPYVPLPPGKTEFGETQVPDLLPYTVERQLVQEAPWNWLVKRNPGKHQDEGVKGSIRPLAHTDRV